MYSYLLLISLSSLIGFFPVVEANYRHLQIDNNDMCREVFPNKHKRISIGTGALILTLSKPRIAFHPHQRKSKLCEIHIQAPEGFGITTYVEEAYLRKNSSDNSCKDYIQFGLDDKLPFLTLDKSQPICGHIDGQRDVRKGFMYDDPHGNLLIWINLFGRKETSHWPAIYTVNLTLVITAYQLNCGVKKSTNSLLKNVQRPGPGFQWCGKDPGPCISKDYFCDKRFNCLAFGQEQTPYDEISCQYEENSKETSLVVDKDDDDDDDAKPSPDDLESMTNLNKTSLNSISWILIGICSILGLLLILVLTLGCTKNAFCKRNSDADAAAAAVLHTNDCHQRDLADLSANRIVTEENVYIPLETFHHHQPQEEAPPPSYDSLFPATTQQQS